MKGDDFEKTRKFNAHILTGDDAKVGDISVHLLLDGD